MQNRFELHLHMDGSLSEKTVNALVKKNYSVLNDEEKRLLERGELYESISVSKCNGLEDYLKKFDLPCRLLQDPEDVEMAFYNLVTDLSEQGIMYAEIRFAPQLHSANVKFKHKYDHECQILDGAIRGVKRGMANKRIIVNLILCCMRGEWYNVLWANKRNVRLAKEFLDRGVCAIDLAGAEAVYPTRNFAKIFKAARKDDIPFTIHAGESGAYEKLKSSLISAIDFGAKRIGHGIGLMYFPELQETVKEKRITLECCIKSNLDTNAVLMLSEHPAKKFYDSGILVTLNTDNMTVSSTSLTNEYNLAKNIGFTDKDIARMQEYAFNSAFMTESQRTQIKQWMQCS